MAMAMIEISTMIEISFCEALIRMGFAGYEPLMIAVLRCCPHGLPLASVWRHGNALVTLQPQSQG